MVILSAPSFDLDGVLVLRRTEESRLHDNGRRVSRTATLDGGAVLTDLGWSEADRTLKIVAREVGAAELVRAEYLAKTYPLLTCATEMALYSGALSTIALDGDKLTLTFLVLDKLN